MGEDSRAADAGGGSAPGFRARSPAPGRTAGSQEPTGYNADRLGRYLLNEAELTAWGRTIGARVELPAVLALRGELGAGKSVLARAVARGAGVTSPMPSPTYNLLFQYPSARGEVLHFDLYRLESAADVWELGWSDLGEGAQLVMIEWPERAEELLPPDRWDITLETPAHAASLREVRAARHGQAPPLPEPT